MNKDGPPIWGHLITVPLQEATNVVYVAGDRDKVSPAGGVTI